MIWPSVMKKGGPPEHVANKKVVLEHGGCGEVVLAPGGRKVKFFKVQPLALGEFERQFAKWF